MDFSLNDYLLVFIILTSGLLLLFPQALSGGVKSINVKDAVLLMNREACTIVDVRTEEKFNISHIPNAISIPYSKLPGMLEKLNKQSKKTILVYCGSGNSSGRAMKLLNQEKFESVLSIEGGFSEWSKLQLPVTQKNI
ncbi:rhodanese-like domain-containing protein [Methylophilaceae bacterium]|nr:rhodanese-like domain-containing protein [Methylophilaceae bacterium]